MRPGGIVLAACLLLAVPARAQHEHPPPVAAAGWTWSVESSTFLTGNFQIRKFRDFHQAESQNWLMGSAARRAGAGNLSLHGMLSFEPFTLRALGSAQAFQTGETLDAAPLIDYQHPHDLFMALAARYERPLGGATLIVRGGLVDHPALGPAAFMHRPSAALHPTAPLAHHQLDSAHITHGVVTTGVRVRAYTVEASAFRGREPDDDRLDLDLGPLDSYAARLTWQRGGTRAQVSAGRLHAPHLLEPGDVTRITASIEHAARWRDRRLALLLAWGENQESYGDEAAWLAELALQISARGTAFARGELVDKHILEAGGQHPPGITTHHHPLSRVGAVTLGYTVDLWRRGAHTLAIGGDATGYRVPAELFDSYGRPLSAHLFARWQFQR